MIRGSNARLLALAAADVSLEFRLSMADSIVYATARAEDAELVTSDGDLRGLPGVTFLPSGKEPPLVSWGAATALVGDGNIQLALRYYP